MDDLDNDFNFIKDEELFDFLNQNDESFYQ